MRWMLICLIVLGSVLITPSLVFGEEGDNHSWPKWRGADMSGLAHDSDPPMHWSESSNVAWKIPLPGRGSSTPILWKDLLYVLTAVPTSDASDPGVCGPEQQPPTQPQRRRRRRPAAPIVEHAFKVMAIERDSGATVWEQTPVTIKPHQSKQQNNSFASASAITDGDVLLAYFGSRGLFCYDLTGELMWEKDLGDMNTRNSFGEGSTPALHGETIVINWDHEGQSFIVALDKKDGHELWRVERDEITTWATPLVVELAGRAQVITTGTNRVRSYDLDSGELVWEGEGLTLNAIPTPVTRDGVVFLTSGYRGSAARAVRLDNAHGDVTGTDAVVWEYGRDTPYVPSPLLYGDNLYLVKSNSGILSNLDPDTGQPHYGPVRLEGIAEIYASPVGASNRVYIVGREGNAVVLENSPELKILATNHLEDGFDASPVIVDDEMYLRGYRNLYKIAAEPSQ